MQKKTFVLTGVAVAVIGAISWFAIKSGGYVEVNVRPGFLQVKIDRRADYPLNVPASTKEKLPESNPPSLEP